MNKRLPENFQPEQHPNSEQEADNKHFSPSIANAMLPAVESLECCHCGNEIDEDYYREKDNEIYCDNCYHEQIEFTCPICEDYHENPETPQEHFVYLHSEQDGYKPGFYNVLRFPVYISDMFSATLCSDALKLASDTKVYKHDKEENLSGFICKECFDKKGLDEWHIKCHIKQAFNKAFKPRKFKNWKRIIVNVSETYYEILKGSYGDKKVKLIKDSSKKTQELSVRFELEAVSTP